MTNKIDQVTITTLAENTAGSRGLLGEHGLAFHIQAGDFVMLFDTGQGQTLAHNAAQLGVDLQHLDAIALSHGHYDHTGGLRALLEQGPRRRLYIHPAALQAKYNRRHEDIGGHLPDRPTLEAQADVTWTTGPTWLTDTIWLTGEIPRITDFEDTGGPFYTDSAQAIPDTLADDQALVIDTEAGLIVVLGCGHSGVINTLKHIQTVQDRPIHALLGGMHLVRAAQSRLEATLAALADWDIAWLAPAHCTGVRATSLFWTRFPDRCLVCNAGSRLSFGAV